MQYFKFRQLVIFNYLYLSYGYMNSQIIITLPTTFYYPVCLEMLFLPGNN